MQTKEETQNVLERRVAISVPAEDVEKGVEAKLKQMSRTVKMPGFRPGKVPLKLVAQNYGDQARSEVIGEVIERILAEQVREQNLRVAGYPQIQPKEDAAEGALEFEAIFEVYPEVVVSDLTDKELERSTLEVTDAEVDKTIDVLRKQRTTYELVERAAQEGDRVVVDFTGRKDGEVFEGGAAEDFPFVLGGGQMLKDFETAATGLTAGESKTFDLTFPEDYHAKLLAGQTVQFEIVMKKVEAPKLPEVDADFARALGVADGDIAKLREEVTNNLQREVRNRLKARIKAQVMDVLLDVAPIAVPRALVDNESRQMADNARRDMEGRGMNAKDLPISPAWFYEQAERRVKLGLIMAEVVKANELYAKPEQIRGLVEEFAASYENPQEVVEWYYQQPQRLAQAEALVVEENVVEWALGRARTTDKAVSFDELMGNAS